MNDVYILGSKRASAIARYERGEEITDPEESFELALIFLSQCIVYKAEAEALLLEMMNSEADDDWGTRAGSIMLRENAATSSTVRH